MFIVLEIQTNENNESSILTNTYSTRNEADNKYYTILAYAAISEITMHTAMIVTVDGQLLASKTYNH